MSTTREEINEQLKELLKQEDFAQVIEKMPALKTAYDEAHRAFYKAQEDAFFAEQAEKNVEDEEKQSEEKFQFQPDQATHRFKELYAVFVEKKQAHKKALVQKEEENLATKKTLIEKLKTLTEQELKNFGETFEQFKTIQTEWKAVGDVNKKYFNELQTQYSHLIDKFFYNVNIHKDLKNYSFEKNKEAKQAIINKLEELQKNESIIQLEHYIKTYQKEWDEIGPTFQEDWEKLKEIYWQKVGEVYDKIRKHYADVREKQKQIVEKKEELIASVKEVFEKIQNTEKPAEWNNLSNKVKDLQQEWKKVGFTKRNKEEELWTTFRAQANAFFDYSKEKFEALNEKRTQFEKQKLDLIAKANELKDSKDWKNTSNALIKLQQEWKTIGRLKPQKDQKLWLKFREACNVFFNNKSEYFGTLDERQEENLKQKQNIAESIAKAENQEQLQNQLKEWWIIGHVPKKAIAKTNESLKKAISKAQETLKIKQETIDEMLFATKIDAYKQDDDAENLLQSEKRFINEKISKIKDEIHQFENNLSFFGESKGAQKLKEVVEKRIADAQHNLAQWQNKLKKI